jgi:hypothetical protein
VPQAICRPLDLSTFPQTLHAKPFQIGALPESVITITLNFEEHRMSRYRGAPQTT